MSRRGFTKTPNSVLFNAALTFQERAFYSMLLHLIWLHRPDPDDGDILGRPIPMPVSEELAEQLGISLATFKRYLNKLREFGYVRTERPRRQSALIYTVYARPTAADGGVSDDLSSGVTDEPSPARAVLSTTEDVTTEDGPCGTPLTRQGIIDWERAGAPPPLQPDRNGRVIAIDAIASLCRIRSGSPRYREVAVALHGNRKHLDTQPGINRLLWLELAEAASITLPELRAFAVANQTRYHKTLVDTITRRAMLYQERMPDVPLTPTALAKWWLDLEEAPATAGVSSDDLRAGRV